MYEIFLIVSLTILLSVTFLILFSQAVLFRDIHEIKSVVRLLAPIILHSDRTTSETLAHNRALDFSQQMMMPFSPFGENQPMTKEIFRTEDGKHTAGSLEELLRKIKDDPSYYPKGRTADDDSKSEYDQLKDMFRTDDDDEEDWKKDKN